MRSVFTPSAVESIAFGEFPWISGGVIGAESQAGATACAAGLLTDGYAWGAEAVGRFAGFGMGGEDG